MTKQYAFRLPAYLVERIDRYAAMRARVDGRKCTRTDALRLLIEKGLALEMPAKVNKGPAAFETPARAESVSGLVTDSFEPAPAAKKKQRPRLVTDSFEPAPAAKKKQRPHRRQDRVPGVAFSQATDHIEGPKKKKP